jgi:hypothetical protein
VPVTVFPLPTFFVSNVAFPPERLTSSPEIAPLSDLPLIVAEVPPSYVLLLAEKFPLTDFAATVSDTSLVVEVFVPLHVLVKTAWYLLPLAATPGFVSVSVVLVAPEMLVNAPPFTLNCH